MKIIPLDDNGQPPINNQQINSFRNPSSSGMQGAEMSRIPFISDPSMIPRIHKYLESNMDKTYIDVDIMADDLQRMHKDYARRKRKPFRTSVKKAYAAVMRSYGQDNNVTSSDELTDESGEDEESRESRFGDPMNNQLIDMYSRPRKPLEENELIDISSDDSNDDSHFPHPTEKTANGASTSQKPKHSVAITPVIKKPISKPIVEDTKSAGDRGKKRKNDPQDNSTIQSVPKRKKPISNAPTLEQSRITFKDVGGLDKVLETVCKLLVHVRHPEVYRQLGITPPRGFLLHGPPGCGKTLLANAIAGELNIPMIKVAAPELVAGVSGESEERIRDLFERATATSPCILFIDEVDAITPNRQNAQKEMERRIVAQLLSCLDDLSSNESGDRVLVIGATNRPDSMDPALRRAGRFDREVCLGIPDIQARAKILKVLTNNLKLEESVDFDTIAKYTPGFVGADLMALTREAAMVAVNRVFNTLKEKREMETALALQKATQELLQKQSSQIEVVPPKIMKECIDEAENSAVTSTEQNEIDVVDQANSSDPIVVIDDDVKATDKVEPETTVQLRNEVDQEKLQKALELLQPHKSVLESLILWLHDDAPLNAEQLSTLCITMEDMGAALKVVQPSAKREGFAMVPDVTWDDIGSLRNIREELQMAILAPVQHAEQFKALGLTTPTGVLLCGPPGCGKTLLAKAIANEAGINFISVKGPELLNMYVGESEKAVRLCFERARNSAPCVIFFDELDSLCPKRSETGEGGVTMRVVNQMLTEMDGVEDRAGVYLLAATNRPDIVDPAVLRPGRLDKIIYVGLPSAEDRADILRAVTKNGTKPLLATDVDLQLIGKSEQCDGYTGADLAALVREAGIIALKEFMVEGNQQRPLVVATEHFKRAIAKIRPSISEKDQKHYEKLKKIYSVPCGGEDVEEMEYS